MIFEKKSAGSWLLCWRVVASLIIGVFMSFHTLLFDAEKFRKEYSLAMHSLQESGDVGKSILKQLEKVRRRIDRNHDEKMGDQEGETTEEDPNKSVEISGRPSPDVDFNERLPSPLPAPVKRMRKLFNPKN